MIHGIKSSSVKVYRYFPELFTVKNRSGLRRDLIVPDQIDLGYELCVALGFRIVFEIFFQHRVIPITWVRNSEQAKPLSQRNYLLVFWWVLKMSNSKISKNGMTIGRVIKLFYKLI